jgi:hypothetical protein
MDEDAGGRYIFQEPRASSRRYVRKVPRGILHTIEPKYLVQFVETIEGDVLNRAVCREGQREICAGQRQLAYRL